MASDLKERLLPAALRGLRDNLRKSMREEKQRWADDVEAALARIKELERNYSTVEAKIEAVEAELTAAEAKLKRFAPIIERLREKTDE